MTSVLYIINETELLYNSCLRNELVLSTVTRVLYIINETELLYNSCLRNELVLSTVTRVGPLSGRRVLSKG